MDLHVHRWMHLHQRSTRSRASNYNQRQILPSAFTIPFKEGKSARGFL